MEKKNIHGSSVGNARRNSYRLAAILSVVILTILVIGVNILVNLIDEKNNLHVDMSQQQYYTITKETKNLLKDLKQDVYIYTLYTSGNEDVRVSELLRNYESHSDKVHVENVDPSINPAFTLKYDPNSEGISEGSVIVSNADGSRYKVFTVFDLYSMNMTATAVYSFNAESRISSAIDYLNTGINYTIKLLAGHSEKTRQDLAEFIVSLNALNFDVESYDSTLTSGGLDPKNNLLVIASPGVDLSAAEYQDIKSFLDAGGNAIFLIDYVRFDASTGYTQIVTDNLENFNSLLLTYGLKVNKDYVLGDNPAMLYKRITGHAVYMYEHAITKSLVESGLTPILMDCSSISITQGETVKAAGILETDKSTWSKKVSTTMNGNRETGDPVGPFTLGAVAQRGDSKIALFSTSSFIASNEDGIERTANKSLIMNTVNTLAERQEGLNIGSKSLLSGVMEFSNNSQVVFLEILVVAIIPVIILVIGFAVWIRRKRR